MVPGQYFGSKKAKIPMPTKRADLTGRKESKAFGKTSAVRPFLFEKLVCLLSSLFLSAFLLFDPARVDDAALNQMHENLFERFANAVLLFVVGLGNPALFQNVFESERRSHLARVRFDLHNATNGVGSRFGNFGSELFGKELRTGNLF